MSGQRDESEAHELLPPRKELDVKAADHSGDYDNDSDHNDDGDSSADDGDLEQGHAYDRGEGMADGKRSLASGDSPYSWKRSRRFLAGLASAVFFAGLLVVAATHPVPRDMMRDTWHRLPFGGPSHSKQQDLMASMPRVERNSSVSLKDYLEARFDPATTNIMWTMATGASPSYVPNARNWDLKRAELGMTDSVVILCLDYECLDECERTGLRAHSAFLKEESAIPPPSQKFRLAKRPGAERGHVLAFLKFRAMLEMAQSGFYSLFFEGDTFLTADPFDHMLSRNDDSWDLQFTVDWGYLLNFGFIFISNTQSTVSFFQHAYDQYVAHNQWDQELLSNMVLTLGGREWHGESGKESWWICDQIGLRLYMLPLHKFWATHIAALEWHTLPPDAPEPIMTHLSAVTYANRQFYPKERGWATNVDAFYTSPRPILRASPIEAEVHAAAHYARMLHIVAVRMGWALQIPDHLTVHGEDPDGKKWTYTREWTRLFSVEPAVTLHLDLLEANYFEHAARYLPVDEVTAWQSRRETVDMSKFASLDAFVEHLVALNVSEAQGRVIEVVGYDAANSNAAQWPLDSASVSEVSPAWREVPMCQGFHKTNLPFPWCIHLPLSFA